MKYVLDTNTVSAIMRADVRVLMRLKRTNRRDVALPQPVIAEIAYGIARLPKSRKRRLLEDSFETIVETFERSEWSDEVSRSFGVIKASLESKGVRIEDFDVAIAAHAVANDATLVTDNVKHMTGVADLRMESWTALP